MGRIEEDKVNGETAKRGEGHGGEGDHRFAHSPVQGREGEGRGMGCYHSNFRRRSRPVRN
jgi:hypothetical protein